MEREFDANEPEWMDRPQPVSAELEDDLTSLEWLNRRFGAHRFLEGFLQSRFHDAGNLRILDLATGGGDLPRVASRWAGGRGIAIHVDALDMQPATLEIAAARSRDFPAIHFHQHDILQPWRDGGYDLVMSFLSLHHFSGRDAVLVLKRMLGYGGRSTLVLDLERSRRACLAIDLLTRFVLTAPMTRHDARLSIRRAFNRRELAGLARDAGWDPFRQRRVIAFRQAIWKD